MEQALCDSASAYEGRIGKADKPLSGLCLVMTLVLEAIQQQFHAPLTQLPPPHQSADPNSRARSNGAPHPAQPLNDPGAPAAPSTMPAATNGERPRRERPASARPFGGLSLQQWLQFAFVINSLADTASGHPFPPDDLRDSLEDGTSLLILKAYAGRTPDFSFLESPDGSYDELNEALRLAEASFRARKYVDITLSQNGYCLALALILEAIRQRFPSIFEVKLSGGGKALAEWRLQDIPWPELEIRQTCKQLHLSTQHN